MASSSPLAQGLLEQIFSFKRGSTANVAENGEKMHRFFSGAFDGYVALKGFGSHLQSIEIPVDPQDILDGNVPFNFLVLKPQSAAFDEALEALAFIEQDTSKFVLVIFTNTSIGASLPMLTLQDDGPGMWVLVIDVSNDLLQVERAIPVTDGTNILIPEVHLAELTGLFGDVEIGDSAVSPGTDTWSKCLPFARFTFSTVLTLPQSTYDLLLPQLPIGALIAITE